MRVRRPEEAQDSVSALGHIKHVDDFKAGVTLLRHNTNKQSANTSLRNMSGSNAACENFY